MRRTVFFGFVLMTSAFLAGCKPNALPDAKQKPAVLVQAPLGEDVADTAVGATASIFATGVGGAGTNNKGFPSPALKLPTICDSSSSWDFPLVGAKDGYQTVTSTANGNGQIHVCSYAIMNGANQQDVSLFEGDASASSSSGVVCNNPPKPFMVYHLAPYESITRGSGIGSLYTISAGKGICIHRSNGNGPLGVEFTYAMYQ